MNLTLRNKQSGFSIVELMISISLGAFLTAGLINIYVSNRASYAVQEGLARLQENSRFAQHFFTQDIRMAGLQGCNHIDSKAPTNIVSTLGGNETFTTNDVVSGHQAGVSTWTPAIPAWLTANLASGTAIAPGTDVIIVRKQAAQDVNLTANMSSNAAAVTIANKIAFANNDIVFITDCESTDIFRATSGTTATSINHTTAGNTTGNLSKAYQTDARVTRLETIAYYVKDTGRTNNSGNPVFALYRQLVNGTEEELIEGVENIQVTYGVDTNSDGAADSYLTADAVNTATQWPQVVSVNISTLMNTVNDVSSSSVGYTFNGAAVTPTDRLLRRQIDSYVKIRNRSL